MLETRTVDKVYGATLAETFFGQVDPVNDYLCRLIEMLRRLSRDEIYNVVQVLYQAWQRERHIFVCGNGGSASTASHMVNDLCKLTIIEGQARVKAIALTDNVALMTAWSNDTEYENVFAEQLRNLIEPGDVVIGISASGNSPNILRTMEVAREYQAICIGLTGDTGGKLKAMVDHCISIPDDYIGRQEDGHLILDHVIATTLRGLIMEGANR
jgi:D-sedoheptulose 7-phosphate isomerase